MEIARLYIDYVCVCIAHRRPWHNKIMSPLNLISHFNVSKHFRSDKRTYLHFLIRRDKLRLTSQNYDICAEHHKQTNRHFILHTHTYTKLSAVLALSILYMYIWVYSKKLSLILFLYTNCLVWCFFLFKNK